MKRYLPELHYPFRRREKAAGGGIVERHKKLYSGTSYPVLMELRYKAMNPGSTVAGIGTVLEMSSNKVLLTANGSIEPGTKVELSIEWPALLDNRVSLHLVIEARIINGDGRTLTADIQKYRFRTRGTGARLQQISAVVIEWPGSRASRFEQPLLFREHA